MRTSFVSTCITFIFFYFIFLKTIIDGVTVEFWLHKTRNTGRSSESIMDTWPSYIDTRRNAFESVAGTATIHHAESYIYLSISS